MNNEISDVTETIIDENVEDVIIDEETETNPVAQDNEGDNIDLSFTDTQKYSQRLKRDREKMREEILAEQDELINKKLSDIAIANGFETWDEYQEQVQAAQLDNLGVTDADAFKSIVEKAVAESDVVKEARKIVDIHNKEKQKELVNEELKKIEELDPSIKTIADLSKLDNYNEFEALVKNGHTLVDAFKLTNFDRILADSVNRKQKEQVIKTNSTNHQKETKTFGAEVTKVDDAELNVFRSFYPNLSEADVLKKYNAIKGGNKK